MNFNVSPVVNRSTKKTGKKEFKVLYNNYIISGTFTTIILCNAVIE